MSSRAAYWASIYFFTAALCCPAMAKVVSIVDAPGDYTSIAAGNNGRTESGNAYKLPDKRCEKFVGYFSSVPDNQDCSEVHPFPNITCYKNCRCAYGTAADCTCNSSRYFPLNNLPRGTEISGDTCKTKSLSNIYYAVHCKKGFVPDAGSNTCSCTYGNDTDCLCDSREYPLSSRAEFDHKIFNYAKCKHGNYYKISGCKQEGYQLLNNQCKPECAEGYSTTTSVCREDHRLVEQKNLPVCKKCEKITCPSPYTFVNDCPDGTRVSNHPTQSGCFKCEGVPCRNQYHTYTVCRAGQKQQTQADNPQCVYCEGYSCKNGYRLNAVCLTGQIVLKQENNPLCQKCSGTACAYGYSTSTSCKDGQAISVQSDNRQCKRCIGTPCRAGYSTRISSCSAGTKMITQNNNLHCRKCDNGK